MKKLIALLLALCLPPSAALAADTVHYIDGEHPVEDGYIIFGYNNVVATEELCRREVLSVPAEIGGHKVEWISTTGDPAESNVKEIILPETVKNVQGISAPKLEKINLDNVKTVYPKAFLDCENLKYINENNDINFGLYSNVFQNTGLEYVTLRRSLMTDYGTPNELFNQEENFMDCKELRTVYIPNENLAIGRKNFANCTKLDYLCFDSEFDRLHLNAFANCVNLRTAVFYGKASTLANECHALRWENDVHLEPVFENCPKLTIIGRDASRSKDHSDDLFPSDYAEVFGVKFIPAIIDNGETSTVVAHAAQTATVYINGTAVPAYTLNGSVYIKERNLSALGFGLSWDGEARTTTITKPENVQFSVELNTNPEPNIVDIVSSDIKFMLDGFPIPALNIGNGESIIDVNALAEAVLY